MNVVWLDGADGLGVHRLGEIVALCFVSQHVVRVGVGAVADNTPGCVATHLLDYDVESRHVHRATRGLFG